MRWPSAGDQGPEPRAFLPCHRGPRAGHCIRGPATDSRKGTGRHVRFHGNGSRGPGVTLPRGLPPPCPAGCGCPGQGGWEAQGAQASPTHPWIPGSPLWAAGRGAGGGTSRSPRGVTSDPASFPDTCPTSVCWGLHSHRCGRAEGPHDLLPEATQARPWECPRLGAGGPAGRAGRGGGSGPHLALMRYWARLMLAGVPVMVIWRSDEPSVALAILICAPDICRISLILVPWRPMMQPISWRKGRGTFSEERPHSPWPGGGRSPAPNPRGKSPPTPALQGPQVCLPPTDQETTQSHLTPRPVPSGAQETRSTGLEATLAPLGCAPAGRMLVGRGHVSQKGGISSHHHAPEQLPSRARGPQPPRVLVWGSRLTHRCGGGWRRPGVRGELARPHSQLSPRQDQSTAWTRNPDRPTVGADA